MYDEGNKKPLIHNTFPMKEYQKLLRRLISHPSSALEIVRKLILRRRKCCPKCGTIAHPQIHHTDKRGIRTYQCNDCKKTFSELYGTIFYRSKISLANWMLAIIYWATATGSISAADLGRKLGISHLSAWKMLMKIRRCMEKGISDDFLQGIVEADEAWFGRNKSKPENGKIPKFKTNNQDIILGIVQRGRRKLRLMPIPNVQESTLYPEIRWHLKKGSELMTDSRNTYAITGIEYHHQVTNHSKGEFARGNVHSNTIEQIWGDIKGIIRTVHHGIKKKYRHLYLAQYIFRYENKDSSNLFFKSLCQLFTPTYCLI